jgi:hypothetical protein
MKALAAKPPFILAISLSQNTDAERKTGENLAGSKEWQSC